MAAKKLPKGYYDPADYVLVHRDYFDGLIDALVSIHKSSGDPVVERICEAALGQQLPVAADLIVDEPLSSSR